MPANDTRPARAPDLDAHGRRAASEARNLSAAQTHEAIRLQGEHELERPALALMWSGVAAGLAMGLSLVAHALLHHHLPDAQWRPLVASLGYSVGFVVVILASQQLFTEVTVTAVIPFLTRSTGAMLRRAARLWAIVLTSNLAGALLFAWALAGTSVFGADEQRAFAEVSHAAMEGSWNTKLLRGIMAGWLIGLMAWMLPTASGKLGVIILLTWLVSLSNLTHVVAGAVEAFYLAVTGGHTWGAALGGYILPALIGNAIGGVVLVSALNHAQVAE
jgi:formate/nitrite transporter FocA (FNT family)